MQPQLGEIATKASILLELQRPSNRSVDRLDG
jgi:hypothetical protein